MINYFSRPSLHVWVGDRVSDFWSLRASMIIQLLKGEAHHRGRWQQLDVSTSDAHRVYELPNVTMHMDQWPREREALTEALKPSLPWVEDHFQERVAGKPVNPGNTHYYWPFHANGAELHLRGTRYDHNYMERFWPKRAGLDDQWVPGLSGFRMINNEARGYRFPIGDLADVVTQLQQEPTTRQAYLPVWFPEDTGAVQGQRVPCTLGYHFIINEGRLDVRYSLRSCEVYRHFTNDVYLALRLSQWVLDQLEGVEPGSYTMDMINFHGFVGDTEEIKELLT